MGWVGSPPVSRPFAGFKMPLGPLAIGGLADNTNISCFLGWSQDLDFPQGNGLSGYPQGKDRVDYFWT
jgi:hypothetical protein